MVIDSQNPNQPGIRAHHSSRFKTASIGTSHRMVRTRLRRAAATEPPCRRHRGSTSPIVLRFDGHVHEYRVIPSVRRAPLRAGVARRRQSHHRECANKKGDRRTESPPRSDARVHVGMHFGSARERFDRLRRAELAREREARPPRSPEKSGDSRLRLWVAKFLRERRQGLSEIPLDRGRRA